ncbi:response regulator [Geobacter grbiciae]|uniref:response regulator n=1 Tax=Geobacter grbiciae TaxID=155042 RepID=UPI001C0228D6|nr:response regulator [Geobacter grbiciae]MBT1075823.1 response regulator [Geobacter grbiciae]
MMGLADNRVDMSSEETCPESGDFLFVTTVKQCAGIKSLLVSNGLRITRASNGREALSMLESNPWKVLVADALLPDMDGIELTRAALEKQPRLLVILGVADPPEDFGKTAAATGVAGIVHKPYEADKLFPLLWFLMQ